MRFLRFLVLIAALFAVYAAQYIIDQNPLEFLRTPWISANLPFLRDFSHWTVGDRESLAFYLAGIGALLFGLVAYSWPRQTRTPNPKTSSASPLSPPALFLVAASLITSILLFVYFLVYHQTNQSEPGWTHYLWVLAIGIYLLGSWLADGRRIPASSGPNPEQSWPTFLLILVIIGFLLGWQLSDVPVRVNRDEAGHGLQALEVVAGLETGIFGPGQANVPLIAYYPAALGVAFSGDWLLGNRLAGLYAGLLIVLGVWLLGCELFRRTPSPESTDDGRVAALLAAILTGVGYTFVQFGRMPHYLAPVAWGVLGLWALHRGVRTGSRTALAFGGLLIGFASTLNDSGWLFGVFALLWWVYFLLARRGWLSKMGWGGPGFWAGGGFIFLSPFVGVWLRTPGTFLAQLRGVSVFDPNNLSSMESVFGVQGIGAVLLANAQRAALTFWLLGDDGGQYDWQSPVLDSLIGPLLLLGIGYLLLNLDRLQSWMLLTWLAGAVLLGGALTLDFHYWPRLMPALPAAGLICALAVDRARATIVRSGAAWMEQFTLLVVIGLIVLAGSNNWVDWYEEQTVSGDAASYTGRAIHSLPDERTAVLIDTGDESRAGWGEQTVEFLAGGPYARRRATIHIDNWPVNLPPQSSVLLQPDDQALIGELQSRFPNGDLFLQRNRRGDPVLFVYQLP